VTRLILCSGRVTVDLESSPLRAGSDHVAIARVEQLAPFQNTAIGNVIAQYPNLQEIVWLQEEPRNMGAWAFMGGRLEQLVGRRLPVRYIGRPERASPAVGSLDRHNREQAAIVAAAFADVPEPPASAQKAATNGAASAATNGNGHAGNGVAKAASAKSPVKAGSGEEE
ncbi:MAG: hypothetical protein ACTHQE_18660, partial [Thermomicrobiales bacterium]